MEFRNRNLQSPRDPSALLFYTHALVGGGAERVWAQAAAGLQERGYDVEFCVDWHAPENRHVLPKGMRVHCLGRNHAIAAWRLRNLLASGRYFAALSAVGASNLKLLTASWTSFARTHCVISQHGFYEAESRFLGRLGYRLSAVTSRLAAMTIVVSEALRQDLNRRFGAPLDRISLVYNAIEIPPWSQTPSYAGLRARPNHVLAVGRLVPEKGHVDLLRAISLLPDDVKLTIAGEGPERPKLETEIRRLGLSNRVTLAGYLIDPAPLYREAKLLALSSHTEAFGNVIVEALGFGIPVVATDCGGPAEVLGGGKFGRLCPIGDPEAMAAAIRQTLNDPGDPMHWRARAGEYSVDRVLDRFESVLSALNRRATAHA